MSTSTRSTGRPWWMAPDVTRLKGFRPGGAQPIPTDAVGEQGWQLFDSGVQFPTMVLREGALEHDIERMARWCREHGVSLAPHGKTTMSPQIVGRQLGAGAWGITAATAWQMRLMRDFGVRRVLLANELVEPAAIAWLVGVLQGDPTFDALVYVDSLAGVEVLAAAAAHASRPLQVLVELGMDGGRTGVRTVDAAIDVAMAVKAAPALVLAGTAAYEGVVGGEGDEASQKVDGLLIAQRQLTERLAGAGAFDGREEVVVTAGGSVYFDRVAAILGATDAGGVPVRVVVRSGCTVTHDHGRYEQVSPLGMHLGPAVDPLQAALEVWGPVLSRPEPELALVGFGRRDVPFDAGFPVPLSIRGADGAHRSPDPGMRIVKLNDQHAFVELPADAPLKVGELIGCGVSHPCTTFDKWRAMPLVDDAYRITGAVDILL